MNIEMNLLWTAHRDRIEEIIDFDLFDLNKEMGYDTDAMAEIKK
jgi:hypothetical protein